MLDANSILFCANLISYPLYPLDANKGQPSCRSLDTGPATSRRWYCLPLKQATKPDKIESFRVGSVNRRWICAALCLAHLHAVASARLVENVGRVVARPTSEYIRSNSLDSRPRAFVRYGFDGPEGMVLWDSFLHVHEGQHRTPRVTSPVHGPHTLGGSILPHRFLFPQPAGLVVATGLRCSCSDGRNLGPRGRKHHAPSAAIAC